MSNFDWWYYTLSFTCSLYYQWTLHYFKVTASLNNCNWGFYVFIRLSWNFVGLVSTSSRSWRYNCCWLSHIFKWDNWRAFWFHRNFIVGFFTNTVQARFFKFCIIITLLWVYQFIPVRWPWPYLKVTGVS